LQGTAHRKLGNWEWGGEERKLLELTGLEERVKKERQTFGLNGHGKGGSQGGGVTPPAIEAVKKTGKKHAEESLGPGCDGIIPGIEKWGEGKKGEKIKLLYQKGVPTAKCGKEFRSTLRIFVRIFRGLYGGGTISLIDQGGRVCTW